MALVRMTICYPGAGSVAAVLLRVNGSRLRVAVDGWEDVGEFRLWNGQWYSEYGELVEIDSMPDSPEPEDLVWPAAQLHAAPASVIWTN